MVIGNSTPRWLRRFAAVVLIASSLAAPSARAADPSPFDLPGPALQIEVTRGETTLPIGEVPSLAAGDRLSIRADLPSDQRARYLLVSAFLSGATNPPPKDWIHTAETWKRKAKDRQLSLDIPAGARQMVVFLVPDTGGAASTISDAVRARPGEFVRATQDLNQASLDRSRLDTFMAAIRAQEDSHPEHLRAIAPMLARSLSMKLNPDCLARVIEMQAACLLENRDSLVLTDVHSNSVAETLIGAPTDLALQLSYTREAGLGYYSPYISVVRDIARVFGAFNNPQLRYLPTLGLRRGNQVALLLNAAPSFGKPKSVLVAAMPVIGADSPPRLRSAIDKPLCGAQPGLVLPVEGAPLAYSTQYVRRMMVRLKTSAGVVIEVPVDAKAELGGYVLSRALLPADFAGGASARLHGFWGFDPFDGPEFQLQFPQETSWRPAGDASTLVIGRDNDLVLKGTAAACVSGVTMRVGDSAPQSLAWDVRGADAIGLKLPLKSTRAGDVRLEVRQFGLARPAEVMLKAYEQASRIDAITFHAGDRWGVVSGQRLDEITAVEIGKAQLIPGRLTRDDSIDRLRIASDDWPGVKGDAPIAQVRLSDGRTLDIPVTLAPARPRVTLVARDIRPGNTTAGVPIIVSGEDVLPADARLVFSLRADPGTTLRVDDAVEIATADGDASVILKGGDDLKRQSSDVLIASFDPARLGPAIGSTLRFRIVRGTVEGDWQPLATLVRLPRIDALDCSDAKASGCVLRGRDLFLVDAVAPTPAFDRGTSVPSGYTGAALAVPRPEDGRLYLRSRDAPKASLVIQALTPER